MGTILVPICQSGFELVQGAPTANGHGGHGHGLSHGHHSNGRLDTVSHKVELLLFPGQESAASEWSHGWSMRDPVAAMVASIFSMKV